MNRTIYDAAFAILETQNSICVKLDTIGLSFEYGTGFIGESLESLINNSQTIVMESLNLHETSHEIEVCISGNEWLTTLETLYTDDNDPAWAITMDDFFEFFYKAVGNPTIQDLMWEAMINKNEHAKAEYNSLGHGKIGVEQ